MLVIQLKRCSCGIQLINSVIKLSKARSLACSPSQTPWFPSTSKLAGLKGCKTSSATFLLEGDHLKPEILIRQRCVMPLGITAHWWKARNEEISFNLMSVCLNEFQCGWTKTQWDAAGMGVPQEPTSRCGC